MARPEVLEQRARSEEHEAHLEAHKADMAHFGRPEQDHEDTRRRLRQGSYTSGRVHVPDNRPGYLGGARVCGEGIGRYGAVQSVVEM